MVALAPLVAALVRALAPEIARELARHMPAQRANELCDRKTAPISKRAWDLYAGKAEGFPAFRDGRRVVAKRADVLAWLERSRKINPTVALAAEPEDEDDRALERALGRGGRR